MAIDLGFCITGNIFGKAFNNSVSHYSHLFLYSSEKHETHINDNVCHEAVSFYKMKQKNSVGFPDSALMKQSYALPVH
jgi:hypothetical protein